MLLVKAFFLAFGVLQGFYRIEHPHLVLCLFLSLALSFLSHLPKNPLIRALPLAGGFLMPLLFPEAAGFLALFVFDAVTLSVYFAILPVIVTLIVLRPDAMTIGTLCAGMLLAALLAFALKEILKLRRMISWTKDEADDRALTMKAEQETRAGKQDAEVYAATLAERNRIAREIHDNVGHMLSRAILLTGALKTVSHEDDALSKQLASLDRSLNEAMDSIRESVHNLHDDSVDLEQAAHALVSDFNFCPVTLSCRTTSPVPRNVTYCLLAIIKEALVNIQKHSDATKAFVEITEHPALYQMVIRDNGSVKNGSLENTASAAVSGAQNGMGLQNMRERVEQLSGNIRYSTEDGFRIFLTIPKEPAASGENP